MSMLIAPDGKVWTDVGPNARYRTAPTLIATLDRGYGVGSTIGIAFDAATLGVWIRIDGVWAKLSGDPTPHDPDAGDGPLFTLSWPLSPSFYPAVVFGSSAPWTSGSTPHTNKDGIFLWDLAF